MLYQALMNTSTALIDDTISQDTQNDNTIGQSLLELAAVAAMPDEHVSASNEASSSNFARPDRILRSRRDIRGVSDSQMRLWTRFSKDDIDRLATVLHLPASIRTPKSRRTFPSFDALVITLSRLARPLRLCDLADRFGISDSAVSECVNMNVEYIFNKWAASLLSFNPEFLTPARLGWFASAIRARGCPMPQIWGFIDATIKEICRPGCGQRNLYSGYCKAHCLKYQGVVTPDGIMRCCSFPIPGRRADGACFRLSGLGPLPERHAFGLDGRRLLLWGDPAYGRSDVIASGEKEIEELSADERAFFKEMATFRECIEWTFGKVSNLFALNNYSPALRLYLSPVGQYFLVSVLFTNAHTCLYGSQTSHFYSVQPPSLEEYFVLPTSSECADFSLSQTFEFEDVDI